MIEIVETLYGPIVLIPCPHCGQYSEEDMQTVFTAYRDEAPLRHLDCGKEFYVELSCLTRAAQQRDEAVGKGAEVQQKDLRTEDNVEPAGQICPRCEGTGNELMSMYRKCSDCKGTGQI